MLIMARWVLLAILALTLAACSAGSDKREFIADELLAFDESAGGNGHIEILLLPIDNSINHTGLHMYDVKDLIEDAKLHGYTFHDGTEPAVSCPGSATYVRSDWLLLIRRYLVVEFDKNCGLSRMVLQKETMAP